MRAAADGDVGIDASWDAPVVVWVEEAIDPALAGRRGVTYKSPPQDRERAIALMRLLGCTGEPDRTNRWTAPIAGGRRVVTLQPASAAEQARQVPSRARPADEAWEE
jgi:hypothetical protein